MRIDGPHDHRICYAEGNAVVALLDQAKAQALDNLRGWPEEVVLVLLDSEGQANVTSILTNDGPGMPEKLRLIAEAINMAADAAEEALESEGLLPPDA